MSSYKLYQGDCLEVMKDIPDESIDLTVTSPPYDNLRTYNGNIEQWNFDKFKGIAKELYRVMKDGGVIVWVVSDETVNGSETLSSFKQALYFKELGFSVETMIWERQTFTATVALRYRYGQVFEYMFIFVKGNKPKTFNPIKDRPNSSSNRKKTGTVRQSDGTTKPISSIGKKINDFGQRFNIWKINTEMSNKNRFHPAQFPEQLANDHVISWSNPGDIVFDPFMGSGTTGKVALLNGRNFIGIELDEGYFEIAQNRIEEAANKTK